MQENKEYPKNINNTARGVKRVKLVFVLFKFADSGHMEQLDPPAILKT